MKWSAADRQWSRQVRERDGVRCRYCLRLYQPPNRGLDAHRLCLKSRLRTRFALENGCALCVGHHRWAHANPLEFHEWARDQLGVEEYDALRLRSVATKAS